MRLLASYPIIIPISECSGDLDPRILWSILIVVNAIWLLCFLFALIHNAIINENSTYKESLRDRGYLFIISSICIASEVILLFIGLVCWVATLL